MTISALPARQDGAGSKRRSSEAANDADPEDAAILRELAAVAGYIAHVKQEIGALRANELYRDRIPTAHGELGSVVKAGACATHAILNAAEDILAAEATSFEGYRRHVRGQRFDDLRGVLVPGHHGTAHLQGGRGARPGGEAARPLRDRRQGRGTRRKRPIRKTRFGRRAARS